MTTLLLFRAANDATPWGWPLLDAWDRMLQDAVRRSDLCLIDLSGPAATRRNLNSMLEVLPRRTVVACLGEGAPPEDERFPGLLDVRGSRTLLDAPVEGRVILLFASQSAPLADELMERGALAVFCFRGDLSLFPRDPALETVALQLFRPLAEWLQGGKELNWLVQAMKEQSSAVTAHRAANPTMYQRHMVFVPEGLAMNARNAMLFGESTVNVGDLD